MTSRELVQAEDMGSNSQYSEGLELAQNDKRQTGRLEITPDTVDHVLWIYHVCQLLHMCLRRLLCDYTQGISHSGVECAKVAGAFTVPTDLRIGSPECQSSLTLALHTHRYAKTKHRYHSMQLKSYSCDLLSMPVLESRHCEDSVTEPSIAVQG